MNNEKQKIDEMAIAHGTFPKSFFLVTLRGIYEVFTQAPLIPLDAVLIHEIQDEYGSDGELVALFLDGWRARACAISAELRPFDSRWIHQTRSTIGAVQKVVPSFPCETVESPRTLRSVAWACVPNSFLV